MDTQSIQPQTFTEMASQNWFKAKKKLAELNARYPNAPERAMQVADMLVNYRFYKTPWSLAKGVFTLTKDLRDAHISSVYSMFKDRDGWRWLGSGGASDGEVGFLFRDVLQQYSHETIKFKDGCMVHVYKLPVCTILDYRTSSTDTKVYLRVNLNEASGDQVREFLSSELFKLWNSNFLFIVPPDLKNGMRLISTTPTFKPSGRANDTETLIRGFTDNGASRSLFFYGPPGSGKTTLAYTTLANLGYRTLAFSAGNNVCGLDTIRDVVKLLGIEAVIVDDFDQDKFSNRQLDNLEFFNKNLKVMIGIANSLSGFHPAVLRPGRFDEIIHIECLDEETVKTVLGEWCAVFFDGAKKLPIAYITEFVKKAPHLPDDDARHKYLAVLNGRAEASHKKMNLLKSKEELEVEA
jgi:ATPase family associated with various cellular activities (AAA)